MSENKETKQDIKPETKVESIKIGDRVKTKHTDPRFNGLEFVVDGQTEEGAFYNSKIRVGFLPENLIKVK